MPRLARHPRAEARGSNSFGGGSGASTIESWVAAHFKSATVGGTTVYDLTQASR